VSGVRPPVFDPLTNEHAAVIPIAGAATLRRYVWALLRRHRGAMALLVVMNLVAALAAMVGPQLLGGIVERLAEEPDELSLDATIALFIAVLAVQALAVMIVRIRGGTLGERMLADLREDFLLGSVALPPGVLERAGTGDLLTRINTDIDRMARSTRGALPQVTTAAVWVLCLLVGIAITAPPLALALLAALPPLLIVCRWYGLRAPAAYHSETAGYGAVAGVLAETVDAGRTVEAYGLGPGRVALLERKIDEWVAWERYTLWLRTLLMPVAGLFHVIVLVGVLLIGGFLTRGGWMTLGQLTAGVLLANMLVEPITTILHWFEALQLAQVSLARLVGVQEVEKEPDGEDLTPSGGDIHVDDVSFGYVPGKDVLHEVSMMVFKGTKVALVGPSGAGKSTLGRLVAGMYQPGTGEITLGGVELTRMPSDRARAHIVLINQEHHVFVGPLRDNLMLASPDATDSELWSALATVEAADWVKALPDGLDSRVGAGGVMVTPAQAQQIALARIVLADPQAVVLDEATSLLDPRAARRTERSLGRVLRGRTVIAIAHRLHTAHDADVIVVMADGRVSEVGNHDELLDAGGAYSALWRSWQT
jgi:ABC-type multidrug transport system fused ATPase/permease subunit